jgi:NADPH:quinone reductase-like Zn-dependent oxidoreductase
MRAVVQERYGSHEALELRDLEKPVIGDDDVLVRVHAAGVDQGVWHLMAGLPYLVRVAGYGLRAPKTPVPGLDVAGRIEAIGANVARFQPGDDVFGSSSAAFAEYASASGEHLAPKSANVTFEQAAAMPTSALTALRALRDKAEVRAGERVLIIGAAGGVGTFAVQLAMAFGALVTDVCSTGKVDLVRSIGARAHDVIDYTRQDFADSGQRWDVILDLAGNRSLSHLRSALAPRGTLVIVGGEGGGTWVGGADRQLRALALSPFVRQRLRSLIASVNEADLQYVGQLVEAGRVLPVVDRTYSLEEAPEAIRYLRLGHARGKVVIAVA